MTTITDTATQFSGVPTATKAPGAMDQNDFLRLMTTQLTTQDPFNPMDNTQMVAQMAQFSQVAGIAEMNQSLKDLGQCHRHPVAGQRRRDQASHRAWGLVARRSAPPFLIST